MALTESNTEDRLVQQTFADYLRDRLGWESVYAFHTETFGASGTLGRRSERDVVLWPHLELAVARLNPLVPSVARQQAIERITTVDHSRSLLQHNREFYRLIRDGIPVSWRDETGAQQQARVQVIDFRKDHVNANRFVAVRELKIQGLRTPHYNRRGDLVCFVNGLPLVFIELKAVYRNIRAGFDENLTDYLSEHSIPHAFHHNAFLVVSNGDKARYASITSKWAHFAEWKRNDEADSARVDAQALLDGMLAKDRLLDLVENFVLFDESRPGGTRKVVARNHQVLGVNRAVESVRQQEALKAKYPLAERVLAYTAPRAELRRTTEQPSSDESIADTLTKSDEALPLIRRAHPDLGRLGVFWHTQGSGKSYSMAFFTEKVRRELPGKFTFLVVTDRDDLETQIGRTFVGCGVTDERAPHASSGADLREILSGNHRVIFTLVHKFNQTVTEPYSLRDDIIVMSDEAHRTQAGKFARNMRQALPNAAFIGFTGTPLLQRDQLTRRIFGEYVSRYDFRRSEEDNSTVKLIYENRGEKLGLARLDLNDRIAEAIERSDLDADQVAMLERLLGKDYEVITADDRLDKLADDFVEHCITRWACGKAMFVCIDKVTCGRMLQRIRPRWDLRIATLAEAIQKCEQDLALVTDIDEHDALAMRLRELRGKHTWMRTTVIEMVISEAQNEVRDFAKWGVDIIPHRVRMKTGFETPDGRRVSMEDAFKDPEHPFRVAIVCAMWLTGFDVECLSTMYIDKPMKAHNLMQAIARANRVYPGKEFGVIVDYNGMLRSLREALAQYALGDDGNGDADSVVAPIEEAVTALVESIELAERHLIGLGFDPSRLSGATGFGKIEALRDATEAVYSSDEAKRRFEIMARQIFARMRALVSEPSAWHYAARHDNIETIYRKLQERRDTADVTELVKSLHRLVNEAIQASALGNDHAEGLAVDLSQIDFEHLRREFSAKVTRKRTLLEDVRDAVERKLAAMLAANPLRMDFNRRYQEIIAEYNREKDRATVEATFDQLIRLVAQLDEEERRAAREGLSEAELALFDLLLREDISKADRERLKQGSQALLVALTDRTRDMREWTAKESTRADVRVFILDQLYNVLPRPPFTDEETEVAAERVYEFVWERSVRGQSLAA